MSWYEDKKSLKLVRSLLILVYVIIVTVPVLILLIFYGDSFSGNPLYEAGQILVLLAFPVLALQPVLSARLRLLDKAFALNSVINFHRTMAIAGAAAAFIHPVLLAAGTSNWALLYSFDLPWYILFGKAALLLLILMVLTSLFLAFFRLTFEKWRFFHNLFFMLVIIGVFFHSIFTGSDFIYPFMVALWSVLLAAALTAYVGHKIIRPLMLRKKPFEVVGVEQESKNVWTLRFKPQGPWALDYAPGQFQFITLKRGRELPKEEHHFTISSSPKDNPEHTATIKNVGDFTSTIKETKPGDAALIQAPFGRFSYRLHPWESDLVFIAGGIGITPIMGMIRFIRDSKEDKRVLLLYGNNREEEIVFRKELEEIEESGQFDFRLVHVLAEPPGNWNGESGFITADIIKKYATDQLFGRYYYVCGPPVMMDKVIGALKGLGVPSSKIHSERFSL
ncbi:MAG: ferric reductase-like transmembrane domain-containing protein [Spirochaetia bacterium]